MVKSIAILGSAALVASLASAQAGSSIGPQLNSLTINALIQNTLTFNALYPNSITLNGVRLDAAGTGFKVESVELPDGTVASR